MFNKKDTLPVSQDYLFGKWKEMTGHPVVRIEDDSAYIQCIGYVIPYVGTAWAAYGGPVGSVSDSFMKTVKEKCLEERKDTFMIRVQNSNISGVRGNIKTSFSQPLRESIVDLSTDINELIEKYSKNNRKLVRKYERGDLEVKCVVKEKCLEDENMVYELLKQTASKRSFSLHEKETYHTLLKLFTDNPGSGYITLGYVNDEKPHSCALTLIHGEEAYHLFAGNDDVGYETKMPIIVAHEAMKYASSKGCKKYNLGGIGDSEKDATSSLSMFKENMGGKTHIHLNPTDIVINKSKYLRFKILKNPIITFVRKIFNR